MPTTNALAPAVHPFTFVPPSSMQVETFSPTHLPRTLPALASPQQSLFHSSSQLPSPVPPPGARPPQCMLRRASRFDPMEVTPEEDGHGELGPRHPLRRIREDQPVSPSGATAPPEPPLRTERSDSNVSLPGIKALLNATDQPPLVSPFAGSFFQSPGNSSASVTSPLDSPTARTSRFSSLASSGTDSQGWWAPSEDRSYSRQGSFASSPRSDEPDFKRRRSDLMPIPPDADETARLKWQAQSRNASFPVSASISSASGLRSMLYPPSSLSSFSRGSISNTPLASPLSADSPFDFSSRGSPMTGHLARSFAELTANEPTPSRPRSPTDRRPSLFPHSAASGSEVTAPSSRRESLIAPIPSEALRMSVTRPPSPEPAAQGVRRSSLAELIMAKSGDDVAMAPGGRLFKPLTEVKPEPTGPTWATTRRESTDSAASTPDAGPSVSRDRRNAVKMPVSHEPRRSFAAMDEEPVKQESDAMRGMEVLAESARRVADAERVDSLPGSPKAGNSKLKSGKAAGPNNGSGPKYACEHCGKTFSRPSSLKIHTFSHTGERPYICNEPGCGRRFSVQSNLKRHTKVHLNDHPSMPVGHHRPPGMPMHMGPGVHGGQPPHVAFGYGGHHGPPHPHMVHPSHMAHPPPGYGPPPPGFMGPGFDPGMHPQHFQMRGPPSETMPPHMREMAGRRHSHDVDPGHFRGGHPGAGGWRGEGEWSDEEEDELDEDER